MLGCERPAGVGITLNRKVYYKRLQHKMRRNLLASLANSLEGFPMLLTVCF